MSADVSSMIYVGDVPWHGLGIKLSTPPTSASEIITKSDLDWTTIAAPMQANVLGSTDNLKGMSAIYRVSDTDRFDPMTDYHLGIVNKPTDFVKIVQNRDTFHSIESLLGNYVDTETVAALRYGQKVFGCFRIRDEFKLIDDDVTHYLLILNDHLKPDGKVTIMNTPVRVVCQNTLSEALSGKSAKYRIHCSADTTANQAIATFVKDNILSSQKSLTQSAEKMLNQKISRESVEKLLDELFPYIKADSGSTHDKANETTDMVRHTFLTNCMDVDNLQNYRGTMWQVENALYDFSQHYFMSSEHGVDMERRMLESIGTNHYINKYKKIKSKLAA